MSVTRNLSLGLRQNLSAEMPFFGRMEAPESVTRNFSMGLKLSLSAEMPFSGRMEAPGQLPGISVWE